MKQDNALQVYYDEKLVGTLAMTANRKQHFSTAMNGWNMDFRSAHFLCR